MSAMPAAGSTPPPPHAHEVGRTPAGMAWKLQWADEFDTCTVGADPSKWEHELGHVRNNELQSYQVENARCVNGVLVISSEFVPETLPEDCTPSGQNSCRGMERVRRYMPLNRSITSASIVSKATFGYGQYDARIRIDVQDGSWPAWWFTGVHRDGPNAWPIDGGEHPCPNTTPRLPTPAFDHCVTNVLHRRK